MDRCSQTANGRGEGRPDRGRGYALGAPSRRSTMKPTATSPRCTAVQWPDADGQWRHVCEALLWLKTALAIKQIPTPLGCTRDAARPLGVVRPTPSTAVEPRVDAGALVAAAASAFQACVPEARQWLHGRWLGHCWLSAHSSCATYLLLYPSFAVGLSCCSHTTADSQRSIAPRIRLSRPSEIVPETLALPLVPPRQSCVVLHGSLVQRPKQAVPRATHAYRALDRGAFLESSPRRRHVSAQYETRTTLHTSPLRRPSVLSGSNYESRPSASTPNRQRWKPGALRNHLPWS